MMLIAGTVPLKNLPLTMGGVVKDGEYLVINGYNIPRTQGTKLRCSALYRFS